MRIAIFGIGAMGSLFGARLAPLADVTLIGHWPEQIDALRAGPLRVQRADGGVIEARVAAVSATHETPLPPEFENNPVDVALILTKSHKTELAAQGAAMILKPGGLAITLQNGMGNVEILERCVGPDRAALGVTAQGATMIKPGLVQEGGVGVTHLATRPEIDSAIREIADLLERGEFKTEVVRDVLGLAWGKLAINAAINPLTALLRIPNGALLNSPEARRIMDEAAHEVAAVAAAQGIALPYPDPTLRAEEVAQLTGANLSSMLQDIRRGAETEIDAICGAVMREGARLGVPTPTNAILFQMVKALEETAERRT